MSDAKTDDAKTDEGGVRVRDRRRFDPEGNPRSDAESLGDIAFGPAATRDEDDAAGATEIDKLSRELEVARRRVDELARAYQALQTDREEFKQRLSRERERLLEVERGNVALALVEAVDELDLCLSASANDSGPLATGVRLIREKLLARLVALGVERVQSVGQTFDPTWAEAADMEARAKRREEFTGADALSKD